MADNVKKTAGAKHSGIIVLTKTQLAYFVEGLPKMISYVFPEDVARDMDIVNHELLLTQLQNFIAQNKLLPAHLSILLANDILFARESKAKLPEEKKKEVDAFVDLVPFEYPSTKSVVFDTKTYITVANKEFYESIMNVFKDSGFTVRLVLPLYVFAKAIDLKKGVTTSSAAQLIKHVDSYKQYNFNEVVAADMGQSAQPLQDEKKLHIEVKGKSNKKFLIIGGLFMLFGALFAAYLYVTMYMTPTQPQKISQAKKEPVKIAKQVPVSPTPAVLGAATTTILLQHGTENQNVAEAITKKLQKKGFTSVQNQPTDFFTYNTTVTFSTTVAPQIREVVVYELRPDYPDLFILETASPAADVVILLAPNNAN